MLNQIINNVENNYEYLYEICSYLTLNEISNLSLLSKKAKVGVELIIYQIALDQLTEKTIALNNELNKFIVKLNSRIVYVCRDGKAHICPSFDYQSAYKNVSVQLQKYDRICRTITEKKTDAKRVVEEIVKKSKEQTEFDKIEDNMKKIVYRKHYMGL
jgi:hypothetical protein